MWTNRFLGWTPVVIATACVSSIQTPAFAVQYLSIAQAQQLCFPKASQFVESTIRLTPDQIKVIEKKSGVDVLFSEQKVWMAYSGTALLGWFIVDDVIGKHELIHWALALNFDGSVKQLEILNYRENYGSEIRDRHFRDQFVGKKLGAPLQTDRDIQTISGATLSCRHITDGVKRLLAFYDLVLKKR